MTEKEFTLPGPVREAPVDDMFDFEDVGDPDMPSWPEPYWAVVDEVEQDGEETYTYRHIVRVSELHGRPNVLPRLEAPDILELLSQEFESENYHSFTDFYDKVYRILCYVADERIAVEFLREVIAQGDYMP